MQVVQLLGGRRAARPCSRGSRRHLEPGGLFAAALADPFEAVAAGDRLPPLPDVGEDDGWVFSSLPVGVRDGAGRRGRSSGSARPSRPTGELTEERHTIALDVVTADELEARRAHVGLEPVARAPGAARPADHIGSTVVMCRR